MPDDPSFDPAALARAILAGAETASLGTLGPGGSPFVSLVGLATGDDGAPLMQLSELAVHTANLRRDGRASLLVVAPGGEGGDPLAGARLTLTGRVALTQDPADAARYRTIRGGVSFADFHFWRMEIAAGHLVAGFGRIAAIDAAALVEGAAP